jgi:hypothetical protein
VQPPTKKGKKNNDEKPSAETVPQVSEIDSSFQHDISEMTDNSCDYVNFPVAANESNLVDNEIDELNENPYEGMLLQIYSPFLQSNILKDEDNHGLSSVKMEKSNELFSKITDLSNELIEANVLPIVTNARCEKIGLTEILSLEEMTGHIDTPTETVENAAVEEFQLLIPTFEK